MDMAYLNYCIAKLVTMSSMSMIYLASFSYSEIVAMIYRNTQKYRSK